MSSPAAAPATCPSSAASELSLPPPQLLRNTASLHSAGLHPLLGRMPPRAQPICPSPTASTPGPPSSVLPQAEKKQSPRTTAPPKHHTVDPPRSSLGCFWTGPCERAPPTSPAAEPGAMRRPLVPKDPNMGSYRQFRLTQPPPRPRAAPSAAVARTAPPGRRTPPAPRPGACGQGRTDPRRVLRRNDQERVGARPRMISVLLRLPPPPRLSSSLAAHLLPTAACP
mmetsp:Transcript_44694/g.118295  ORF Transcript_44694/g.118295 Transcript_44694/m.118295 type:complete len:225 (+) Transcript_44694:1819-2493(+)